MNERAKVITVIITATVLGGLLGYMYYLSIQPIPYLDLPMTEIIPPLHPPPPVGYLPPPPGGGTPPGGVPPSPGGGPPPTGQAITGPSLLFDPYLFSVSVGEVFMSKIVVNTAGSNVTAVSAYLEFDPELLEVVSVDGNNSVFPFDADKSVKPGLIKIIRGAPSPGYNGFAGEVATVSFKLRGIGTSDITFLVDKTSIDTSRIILDDGRGTDILKSVQNAGFTTLL